MRQYNITSNRLAAFLLGCLMSLALAAQTHEWQLIHQGNKAFRARQYQAAGSYYNKALTLNANNTRALYNLGNVNLALHQDSLALSLYDKVGGSEPSALVRSMAAHNKGYIFQRQAGEAKTPSQKQNLLKAAISAYKQALRENPTSASSRYNMVLCQKQLKEGKGGGQDQSDKQQQQQQQSSSAPLLNYARQAEQQTRSKLNRSNGQRALDKNW